MVDCSAIYNVTFIRRESRIKLMLGLQHEYYTEAIVGFLWLADDNVSKHQPKKVFEGGICSLTRDKPNMRRLP